MALLLEIDGVDKTSSIDWSSLTYTEVLTKEVDTLDFVVKDTPTKYVPSLGDEVVLSQDGGKLFGGVVIERKESVLGGILIGYQISCKDWSYYLDGRLVVKSYENQTVEDIVLDIMSTYTTGFTVTHVKPGGPTIESMRFNYEQVSSALTKLAQAVGYDWYVDPDMDLHFFDRETNVAPFDLDDTSGNFEWRTLEINQSVVDIRNSIYVRGGNYKRPIAEGDAIDVYEGDGTRQVFPLAYQYDNIVVKKNGVSQSIGIDNITDPNTVDVLYNFTEKIIRFPAAPTAGHDVVVYGDAYTPIIAQARDQTSVETYGEFQEVIIDKSITSVSEAQRRAISELTLYAQNTYEAGFKTTETGLKSGQFITLSSVIRDINKRFKINRITGRARGSDHMEFSVKMISSGEITFVDIMLALLGKDKDNIQIADNEILQRLEIFNESFAVSDSLGAPVKTVGPYLWGSTAVCGLCTCST